MQNSLKEQLKFYKESITNSYSQMLFSNNNWLALFVIVASFIDPFTGLSGLICALSSIIFAKSLGLNQAFIRNGIYSYNSLLVGLAMGVFFHFTLSFFIMLLLASFLTLFITISIASVTAAYKIPFLSLPFIFSIWTILLCSRSFGALQLSERSIYTFNELWNIGGAPLVNIYEKTNSFKFPFLAEIYLKSLGAIFFQYNIISGLLIMIGLFIYSRIAFSMAIIGFLTGYLFCYFIKGNLSELEYSYIGFNYILSSIAIGGYFLIASPRSYLLAFITVPLVGLLISALGNMVSVFQLPLYSLPFSLVVILVLFALNNRFFVKKLNLVQYQQFSPEKNLYAYKNSLERFKNDTYFHIQLPFYGQWFVSQAHEGDITHKEDYRFAWDFVVTDETQKTFRLPGKDVSDFYCYALPILAPFAGYVVNLVDGIEDNAIGDVNLGDNWGNSIVIKHGDYFFSKISHIKINSFKVKIGDYVKKGDILATCGNSGRSPEPHIHFQLQATEFIGAKTLKYPIAYYVSKLNNKYEFHSFDYPLEGQQIFRTTPTPLLSNAFHFVPGMVMEFEVTNGDKKSKVKWEVFVDASNLSYIYCYQTKSVAYFVNNETLHYFTAFKGDTNSLLYYFYLGTHKVILSYFQDMKVTDALPISGFYSGLSTVIQDFVAPFSIFLKAEYTSTFKVIDDYQQPKKIKIASVALAKTGNKINREIDFEIELAENRISKFTIKEKDKWISAENIGE